MAIEDTRYELMITGGARKGETISLDAREISIGRSRSNTIALEDPLVSRHHLTLVRNLEGLTLMDLGSAHGTFLNDKRVRGSVPLNDGDTIQLGNVCMRFVCIRSVPSEATSFSSADMSDDPDARTRMATAEFEALEETGFADPLPPAPIQDEDSLDKTRVVEEGETRIMDDSELKGLRASPVRTPAPHARALMATVLVMLAMISAAVFLGRSKDDSRDADNQIFTDAQHGFSVRYPGHWKKTEGSSGSMLGFEAPAPTGSKAPRVDVFADTVPGVGFAGLQAGFEVYKESISDRRSDMVLDGSKVTSIGSARVVFYGFSTPASRGKGIFVVSGDSRICIECCAPAQGYDSVTEQFGVILKSFSLANRQVFTDFPMPDEAVRKAALANPAQVSADAEKELTIGEGLLKNASVRSENLYLSVQTLKRSLSIASALGTRPAFYDKAAGLLAEAESRFDQALKDQQLQIVLAEKRQDRQAAYWESVRLTQMTQDKNSDAYQFAAKRVKLYGKDTQ